MRKHWAKLWMQELAGMKAGCVPRLVLLVAASPFVVAVAIAGRVRKLDSISGIFNSVVGIDIDEIGHVMDKLFVSILRVGGNNQEVTNYSPPCSSAVQ